MSTTTLYEQVRVLVENLAARWNGGSDVWDRLVGAAGGGYVSPYQAWRRLGPEGVSALFATPEDRAHVTEAFQTLTRYLAEETWFDRAQVKDTRLQTLQGRPVAYLCMEYGLEDWLPIYSGGLGVLAGDVLKESSDMGLPFVGIGLFYRHGFFFQQMDAFDYQTETFPDLDPADLPLHPVLDDRGEVLLVEVPIADRTVYARAWKLQVGRTPLLLLDTDVPQNSVADRDLTSSLYGGDVRTRIEQELVLGVGGVRLLRAMGYHPSVYSMNEGHAAFLGLELLAETLQDADFETALQRTRRRVVYTNHTVVPAGNDMFGRDLVHEKLGPYMNARGIGIDRVIGLATRGYDDAFSMALLAFNLSGKANAVSELHSHVIPREWPGFAVEAVTNGVHVPTWTGSAIQRVLNAYVPDWRGDNPDWEAIRSIPNEVLASARDQQRAALIEYVNQTQRTSLEPAALTIVWARRFAEYKRANLVASDMERLARLMSATDHPVQVLISGKAHPRDEGGKRMMQSLIRSLEEHPVVGPHVAFVPDYRISVGRRMTGGADVWLNTPRKPLEASGTSGMKSGDNGGLQLTVTDGWAAEVDWWQVGWGIAGASDEADAQQLYWYLEDSVVPTFYTRNNNGVSRDWAMMMKNTMIITLSRYSARRMMLDYLNKLYLPLVDQQGAGVGLVV